MSIGMFLQIGGKRESDFTQPLGLLSDCHKRIQRLHQLRRTRLRTPSVGRQFANEEFLKEVCDSRRANADQVYFRKSTPTPSRLLAG